MFKNWEMHFIRLKVKNLLPKIEEIRYLAKLTNVSVLGITETKLDGSALNNEIAIEGYDLVTGCSRKVGGPACFIKHFVAYCH